MSEFSNLIHCYVKIFHAFGQRRASSPAVHQHETPLTSNIVLQQVHGRIRVSGVRSKYHFRRPFLKHKLFIRIHLISYTLDKYLCYIRRAINVIDRTIITRSCVRSYDHHEVSRRSYNHPEVLCTIVRSSARLVLFGLWCL